jgi:hypothetical protein
MSDRRNNPVGGVAAPRLVRLFRSVLGCGFILGGDPARQFDWVNRLLQRVNGCEAMPPIEYLEAVRRAKKDYRSWYLAVFFNVGDGGVKPPFGVGWHHDSWVEIVRVKQHHLIYHYASFWLDEAHRERKRLVIPSESLYRRKWDAVEISLPVLVAKVCDLLIRPSGLRDAMSNPKVKHLFRHGWKHRSSSVDRRHDGVLNSLPNF